MARQFKYLSNIVRVAVGGIAIAITCMPYRVRAEVAPSESGAIAAVETAIPASKQASAIPNAATLSLKDGVYLYGQSPKPEQIGSAYLVFESRAGSIVGAFYLPRSSFDCVYGTLRPNKMALTVVDSYDQTARAYDVAYQETSPVAAKGSPAIGDFGLQGYYPIATVSNNDLRILGVCKAAHPDQVWK